MTTAERNRTSTLYVDRFTRQWVVRDPEGLFWIVKGADKDRERFEPTEKTELEPVPGHYKHMLGITN